MRAEDRRPQPAGYRGGGEGAFQAVVDGQIEGLADEVLAGERLQHREPQGHDLIGGPQDAQRMAGGLAEVEGRVEQDPLGGQARGQGTLDAGGESVQHRSHHPVRLGWVADAVRVGARRQPAGVGDHVAGVQFRGDRDEFGVGPRPGVVHQVDPGLGAGQRDLAAPGVEAEQHPGVALAGSQQEGTHPLDLGGGVDPVTLLTGPDPADVHQIGAVGDQPVERDQRRLEFGEPRRGIERIRSAVHDAHHRRTGGVEALPAQHERGRSLHPPTLPYSPRR